MLAIYSNVAAVPSGGFFALAPGATVEVRREDTGVLASIYSDEAGTTPITNPSAFADSNGRFQFYAAGLERGYSVKVTSGAFNYTLHNQPVGKAAQFDAATFGASLMNASSASAALSLLGLALDAYIEWTVAGNVLTAAVKTASGADPSAGDPVNIVFRSPTPGTGSTVTRQLTAATSISINDTALLGTANNVPFRLWCVAFDDGGTVRLAIINCLSTVAGAGAGRDVTAIFPLAGWGIASATLEDNASDSAQVFYSSGAGVTAKAYVTLGYATWEAGLATAGTWSSGPTRKQVFGPEVPLPGQVIQLRRSESGTQATGTTAIPPDNTIPQITEGDQYYSQAITPVSAADPLRVQAALHWSNSNANQRLAAALFQDATANALKTAHRYENASGIVHATLNHLMLAQTTSSTTMRLRAGSSTGATTYTNGEPSGQFYGGTMNSYLQVEELMG